jgi:hypothetical protein
VTAAKLNLVPKRDKRSTVTAKEWALLLKFRSLSSTEQYCVSGLIDNLAPAKSANRVGLRLVAEGAP